VLSVLLRYTDSDYPFGIFKLFLHFASSPPVFGGVRFTHFLVFCVVVLCVFTF